MFTRQPKNAQKLESTNNVVVTRSPKKSLGALWLVALFLLVAYPAYSIKYIVDSFFDLWSVALLVLILFGVVAGLQMLNRHAAAVRNARLFFVLYVLLEFVFFFCLHLSDTDWVALRELAGVLAIIASFWFLLSFSKASQELSPAIVNQRRGLRGVFQRTYVENLVGQVFTYSMVALLVVAATVTDKSTILLTFT